MEHQVRILHVVVATHEATGLEVVRRPRAPAEEQPQKADPRTLPHLQRWLLGDRLRARVLDIHLEVILQMLTNTRKVMHHRNVERLQFVAVTDAAEL